MARQGMHSLIRRLLAEAELPGELSRQLDDVYGRSLDSLKELLGHLLRDPRTARQLRRQVAFLFDFDEIEHTTVLGLTLRYKENKKRSVMPLIYLGLLKVRTHCRVSCIN